LQSKTDGATLSLNQLVWLSGDAEYSDPLSCVREDGANRTDYGKSQVRVHRGDSVCIRLPCLRENTPLETTKSVDRGQDRKIQSNIPGGRVVFRMVAHLAAASLAASQNSPPSAARFIAAE
jgi:hypothetical protein